KTHLNEALNKLEAQQNRIADIGAELEEILEGLDEEEKELDITNENQNAFVERGIKAYLKEADEDEKNTKDALAYKMTNVLRLMDEEKTLKKAIRKDAAALHLKTKETIENLTDDEVYDLLKAKWISTLHTALRD